MIFSAETNSPFFLSLSWPHSAACCVPQKEKQQLFYWAITVHHNPWRAEKWEHLSFESCQQKTSSNLSAKRNKGKQNKMFCKEFFPWILISRTYFALSSSTTKKIWSLIKQTKLFSSSILTGLSIEGVTTCDVMCFYFTSVKHGGIHNLNGFKLSPWQISHISLLYLRKKWNSFSGFWYLFLHKHICLIFWYHSNLEEAEHGTREIAQQ